MAKSGRLELGYNITDIIGLYSTTVTYLVSKAIELGKNAKLGLLRRSRSFRIIEVGTNRKPVCNVLLVINSNWQPISYRCGVIAAYCSNFGHFTFLRHPLGRLGTTYDVHLGLIGKRVVDFLLITIELFSLGVATEALRAKINRKSAISLQRGQFDPKFHVEGDVPNNHVCMDSKANECPTTVFTQRNFVADFLQEKCNFWGKTADLRFEPPLGT